MQLILDYSTYKLTLKVKDVNSNFNDDILEGNRIDNFEITVEDIIKNAGVV